MRKEQRNRPSKDEVIITTGPPEGMFSAAESRVPIDGRKPWAGASEATLCANPSAVPELEPYNTYKGWLLEGTADDAGLGFCFVLPRSSFAPEGVVYSLAFRFLGSARM